MDWGAAQRLRNIYGVLMNKMNKFSANTRLKYRGFTLIELVMVIVVLGVLAAVALPKFVDLSSEAMAARAKGVAGALSSGSAGNYSQSRVYSQNTAATPADWRPFRAGAGARSLDEDAAIIMDGWSEDGDPRGELYLTTTVDCVNSHSTIDVISLRTNQTLASAEVYCSSQ